MTGFDLIKNEIPNVYDSIEKSYYNKGKITGIHTGFYYIDNLLCGLQKSNLVVIGGRPSMGKTSFALNILENAALKYNTTAAIFSFEMSKEIIIKRLLYSLAKIDSKKVCQFANKTFFVLTVTFHHIFHSSYKSFNLNFALAGLVEGSFLQ